MSEDLAQFVEENWREDFEAGRLSAGYEAALFCIQNKQAIPDWLVELVAKAIKQDFVSSEGKGRGGLPAIKQSRKSALRQFIQHEIERLNGLGLTKAAAFSQIANDLSQHEVKFWTEEMVKAEYYRNR